MTATGSGFRKQHTENTAPGPRDPGRGRVPVLDENRVPCNRINKRDKKKTLVDLKCHLHRRSPQQKMGYVHAIPPSTDEKRRRSESFATNLRH